MKKSFYVTLVAVSLSLVSIAQTNTFPGETVIFKDKGGLDKAFKSYDIFKIDANALNSYVKQQPQQADVNLLLGDKFNWSLRLFPRDIRSESYTLVSSIPGGKRYHKSENKTYKGYVLNQGGKTATLTLDTEFIFGFFEIDNETYFIEPLWRLKPGVPTDWFLVYKVSDILEEAEFKCGFYLLESKKKNLKDQFKKENAGEKVAGECYKVEIAIASDWLMFDNFGSVASVENFTMGNLNNVQANFDDEFADEIQFEIVTQFVSTCSTCDPWTSSTDAETLLFSFRDWGNSGGFGVSYDLASLWSDRNFNGGTIGLAWVGVLCENNRYNILEYFTTNSNQLRVLQAHELGHNFDALHDPAGSGTIMAPSVNTSTTWSTASVNDIDAYISFINNTTNCFSACTVPAPPEANIVVPVTHVCPGSIVPFIDNSANSPTSWNWQFSGGSPTGSSEQHPTVTYENEGVFPVTLTATNAQGSNTTSLGQNIQVDQNGTKYLFYETFENPPSQWQIINPDNDYTWSWTQVGGTAYGKYGMMVNNYDYNNPGQLDGLVSAPISFVAETDLILEIDYAYARYNASNSDIMRVLVSVDGGNSYPFTIFEGQENGNGNFATEPDNQSAFNPASSNDWCGGTDFGADCISLSLNQFSGEPLVMIKIENENDFGNNLFVDNIRISSSCVALEPAIPAFFADATEGCAPFTTTFYDQSIGAVESREWQFEGGTPSVSTEVNPSVFYSVPGQYTVSLTVFNAAGQATSTEEQYITVNGEPVADFTYQIDGFDVFFNNFSQNADEYLWDFGDGQTSTVHSPAHTYATEGEYTVSLTVTGICGVVTFEETILIASPLVADFATIDTSGCAAFSVTFSDNSTGNITNWDWTFEGGFPNTSTEQNPTIEYDSAGVYSVTLTVSNTFVENTIEQLDIIIVNEGPTANFDADNPPGSTSVQFNDNSTGANSYSWDFGDGQTDSIQNPLNIYQEEGNYTVTLIVTNDCGMDTLEQEVIIVLPPEAQLTASSVQACSPTEIQFNAQPTGDEYTYEWAFDGGTPNQSTEINPIITYGQSGQFNVQLIVSNIAGTDTILMDSFITIDEAPTAGFSANNPVGNAEVTFSDNSSGASSYSWDFGDGQIDSTQNPTNVYQEEGDYSVTLIVTNDCGMDTTTQEVTIILPPEAQYSASSEQGCNPADIQFTAQPSGEEYTYEWTFDGGSPNQSNEEMPLITYEQSGVFNVQLIVSNIAGADTILMDSFITIDEAPTAGFSANNPVGNAEVTFSDNSSGASSYSWDFGDGQIDSTQNPTNVYQEEGDYSVTLIVTNDCGMDTTTQGVTIILPPEALFTSSNETGCTPMEIQFTAQPSGEGYTYEWTFDGGSPNQSNEEMPLVIYEQSGQFNVQLIVTNVAGSDTVLMEDFINIDEAPTADFSADNPVGSSEVTFSDNSSGAFSYLWDFGNGQTGSNQNPVYDYEEEGNYTVTLIVANDCGMDTLSQGVIIILPPEAQLSSSTVQECSPAEIQFAAQPSGEEYIYEWLFDGGLPNQSTEETPLITYQQSGIFNVQLIVSNVAGADTIFMQDFITIEEVPETNFDYQANGFTAQFFNNSMNATSYLWQFGDGITSTDENPDHIYLGDGTYIITLTATNDCGDAVFMDTLEINSVFPLVSFTSENNDGCAPLAVQFMNTSENADSITWFFPGGVPGFSSEENPLIIYEEPGTYSVSLVAFNAFGSSALTQMESVVVESLPIADYEFELNGAEVSFTNNSSNHNELEWDFGDGTTGTEENPSHVFEVSGVYEVQLIVENECGADTIIQEVNIIIDGTSNLTPFSEMNVFPNPNSGRFTLEITSLIQAEADIILLDLIGQKLFEDKISLRLGKTGRKYDFSILPAGVYLLQIQLGGQSGFRKVMVAN